MKNGFYGHFGGQYVPEILVPALNQLEVVFESSLKDPTFMLEFRSYLKDFAGRPTPLTFCRRLSALFGAQIYLKREDLLHGGAHKTNQVIGQALLALKMGKKELIAETGAGQHGVACASIAALFGLKCRIYMGKKDCERQALNVFRMKLMGSEVIEVNNSCGTLKDACNEALRDWSRNYETAHYLLGTAAGPHPFPKIVKTFQKMIGDEAKIQVNEKTDALPDYAIACVGGGSNAIGLFSAFIDDPSVELIGVEPAGKGLNTNFHGAPIHEKEEGIFFGMRSYLMQNQDGQIEESYSISAGLDFPSVGPEHAYLSYTGRARYVSVTDEEALNAFKLLSEQEGIIPALESAHALAYAFKLAKDIDNTKVILVNLSGRGDKDIDTVFKHIRVG